MPNSKAWDEERGLPLYGGEKGICERENGKETEVSPQAN